MARVVVCFPQASLSLPAATAADLEMPCVSETPCLFCGQTFDVYSSTGMAFGRECQMTVRGTYFDSTLNFDA